ncbi:MAG: hypothetical protein ACPHCJ_11885 [Oceanococcaceae bacterium]
MALDAYMAAAALGCLGLGLGGLISWSFGRRAARRPAEQPGGRMDHAPLRAEQRRLRGEIAELRAALATLEVRVQTVRQRQDQQLQTLLQGQATASAGPEFVMEDLIELARQGWPASKLTRVARIPRAEAELLQKLHGPVPPPAKTSAAH